MEQIIAAIDHALVGETDENTRLRLKAAKASVTGDIGAAQQYLAAASIPAQQWAAAKDGSLDY